MSDTYQACFVCGKDNPVGLQLPYYYDGEMARAELVIGDRYAGYPGIVHGGIVTALLDEIMEKAIEGLKIWAVTANLNVSFRQPTPTNEVLQLTGWITKPGSRVFRTAAKITLVDGKILAEAEGVFVKKQKF